MQFHVRHRTTYRYDRPVEYSAQALRLTPRREERQRTLSWIIQAPGRRSEQIDAHGNVTHLLTVERPHTEIEIVVSGTIEVTGSEERMPHEGAVPPLAYLAPTTLTASAARSPRSRAARSATRPSLASVSTISRRW